MSFKNKGIYQRLRETNEIIVDSCYNIGKMATAYRALTIQAHGQISLNVDFYKKQLRNPVE